MSHDIPRLGFLARTFHPQWEDVAPLVFECSPEKAGLDISTAKLWMLVLASRHVPYRMRTRAKEDGGGHTVQVRPWFMDQAVDEILLYLNENQPDGRTLILPDLRPVGGLEPTIGAMTCLVLFYWFYSRTYPALALYPKLWLDMGSSEAWHILRGEWWRVFTGLTLHGDGAHVMGNALIGGVFIALASRRMGVGLAWLLTILGGGLGNLINAVVLGAPHNSIGFSTSSFAAAGLLAGMACFHETKYGSTNTNWGSRLYRFIASALIPVAAGLGLLAMLGAGKETDLGAHLFGFLAGLILGLGTGWYIRRAGLPNKLENTLLFAVAMFIPVIAWLIAWLA